MSDLRRELLEDFLRSFGLAGWGSSHGGTYQYDSTWARFLRSVCDLAGTSEPYALAFNAVFEEQALEILTARAKRMAKVVRRWMAQLMDRFSVLDEATVDVDALLAWVHHITPAELRDVVVEGVWEAREDQLASTVWSILLRAARAMEALPIWVERCRERCFSKLDLEAAVEAVSWVSVM